MPRLTDHAQRRAEIAQAVWGVIAERGIEGVTLRAVAAEAGISVGRIQHYHASRDDLVRDACRVMLELATGHYEAGAENLPPRERLWALVKRLIPTTPGFAYGTRVWLAYQAKSVDDPEIAAMVADGQRGAVEEAAGLIRQISPGIDAHTAALRLLALAEGCAVRVLVGSLAAEDALALLEAELSK